MSINKLYITERADINKSAIYIKKRSDINKSAIHYKKEVISINQL